MPPWWKKKHKHFRKSGLFSVHQNFDVHLLSGGGTVRGRGSFEVGGEFVNLKVLDPNR